ncbi:MAG: hypothetical protein ACPGXZ_17610, partial [Saprospiraceae bacterium]
MKKVIFMVLVFSSCSYQKITRESHKAECLKTIEYVNDKWKVHKSLALYRITKPTDFINSINTTYKECFYSLEYNEIKRILGKPNEEIKNEYLVYFIDKNCLGDKLTCVSLVISFHNDTGYPLYISMNK